MAAVRFDGATSDDLATRCQVPRVELLHDVTSTMDVAHALAAGGAAAGTLVLAERQGSGRGRHGRSWESAPGAGLTFTVLERPDDVAALGVLSLRLGLACAPVLDAWTRDPVQLKWPNDLWLPAGKLGGILVEARWRAQQPEWVAIGIGINVKGPAMVGAAGLAPGADRVEILASLLPAVRRACGVRGGLSADERAAFGTRDRARGRRIVAPVDGVVVGLSTDGGLQVETGAGMTTCSAGSLVFAEA